MLHCGGGQIFPFSNLRAFFNPNPKQPKDNSQEEKTESNLNRSNRQTNQGVKLPDLREFDSPKIFVINRDIENHRNYPVKRHPSVEATKTPVRRWKNNQYQTTREQPAQQSSELEQSGSVFITPNPKQESSEETYSKIKSKGRMRIRKPKPQPNQQELEETSQNTNVEIGKLQITTDNVLLPTRSHNNLQVQHAPEFNAGSEEPTFVESVPSLGVAIQQDRHDDNDGLIDYLVPPQHPSVYEKNIKPFKVPFSSDLERVSSPSPTALSKKDTRYKIKKRRNHIKSTVTPLVERLNTTPKRHTVRRRPTAPKREPLRSPPPSASKPSKEEQLQLQGAQMDEQVRERKFS